MLLLIHAGLKLTMLVKEATGELQQLDQENDVPVKQSHQWIYIN